MEAREADFLRKVEQLKAREAEMNKKSRLLEDKEVGLKQMKSQIVNNSSGDSLHSVFFNSEKEAQIKQREKLLEARQKELERRADEINVILKSFKSYPSTATTIGGTEANASDLPLQQ